MPDTIDHILELLLRCRSPREMIARLKTIDRPEPTKAIRRQISNLVEELPEHLLKNNRLPAHATMLAATFADADYTIGKVRRGGMLRASKYGFEGQLVAGVAKVVLDARPILDGRGERFAYLESVVALCKLAPQAKTLHDRIEKILSSRENTALKTVLAILNSRFYHHNPADIFASSLILDRYTVEDASDAASLILDIYRRLFPIHDHCCNLIDVEGVAGIAAVYERLFVAAIRLTKFKDAEVLIDGLPFKAVWQRGAVHISSIDPDLEKSIRLGYIQGQIQIQIRVRHLHADNPPMSVREAIERGFAHSVFEQLVQLVDTPVRRLRLVLPTAPQMFSLFRSDQMFRDEVENLLVIDADKFEELDLDQQIAPDITIRDIFKVQRYFNFISCLYQKKLETFEDEGERAYLAIASTIPVIPRDALFEQFQLIFIDASKSRAMIDLLTLDFSAKHLDLQYTPLIDLGKYFVLAPHVLAASNLVRNVVVAKGLRQFALEAGDPMIIAVTGAFKTAGFKVDNFGGLEKKGSTDLDIVAWRDDVLFLFECKNAYHPCSPHETRNSYDHIRVASDQLDLRRDRFSDHTNQAALFEKLGWDVPPTDQIYTGIVIANRVFHGFESNGHPVRQAHELINVLRSGTIGGDADLKFWQGDIFDTADLVTYLAGDSIAKKQLAAMEPYQNAINLGGKQLIFETFAMDTHKQMKIMTESYARQ